MYLHGLRWLRPLNDRLWLRKTVWLQAKVRERGLGLVCCTPTLYVSHSATAAVVCSFWRYISDTCRCLCICLTPVKILRYGNQICSDLRLLDQLLLIISIPTTWHGFTLSSLTSRHQQQSYTTLWVWVIKCIGLYTRYLFRQYNLSPMSPITPI